MTPSSQYEIQLRRLGSDDWQLWRKLRLEALAEAPYAFSSTLADWQGQGDTETRWRGRLSDVPFNIVAEWQKTAAGMASAIAPKSGRIGRTDLDVGRTFCPGTRRWRFTGQCDS